MFPTAIWKFFAKAYPGLLQMRSNSATVPASPRTESATVPGPTFGIVVVVDGWRVDVGKVAGGFVASAGGVVGGAVDGAVGRVVADAVDGAAVGVGSGVGAIVGPVVTGGGGEVVTTATTPASAIQTRAPVDERVQT